jgi:hypothetical protein
MASRRSLRAMIACLALLASERARDWRMTSRTSSPHRGEEPPFTRHLIAEWITGRARTHVEDQRRESRIPGVRIRGDGWMRYGAIDDCVAVGSADGIGGVHRACGVQSQEQRGHRLGERRSRRDVPRAARAMRRSDEGSLHRRPRGSTVGGCRARDERIAGSARGDARGPRRVLSIDPAGRSRTSIRGCSSTASMPLLHWRAFRHVSGVI